MEKEIFFELNSSNRCRGHKLKFKKPSSILSIRKFSFAHRIIDEWNKLPEEVIESRNLNQFKSGIDRYFMSIRKYNFA